MGYVAILLFLLQWDAVVATELEATDAVCILNIKKEFTTEVDNAGPLVEWKAHFLHRELCLIYTINNLFLLQSNVLVDID